LDKLNDDPKMKELQARLDANGKKIETYYNSPEYKKKQEQIEKQGELLSKYKPGSDEFNKHLNELIKTSVDFGMSTSAPIIKEQVAPGHQNGRRSNEQI
jgi:bla regulator protein BlaR1